MDIRYLETLLAVIDGGSLAEAARRQNLTAAAVGQRIKALEVELGVVLTQRAGPTVRPTAACLRLIPRARSIVTEAAALQMDIAEDGLAGPFRLGAISTALGDNIPKLIQQLKTHAPKVDLTITPGASSHLFEMLQVGDLDAAIMVAPAFDVPKGFEVETIEAQPFAWVTPTGTGASADLPLILYDRASWGGAIAWRWMSRTLSSCDILCEMDAPETVASLVASGVGRAVLPVWSGLGKISGLNVDIIDSLPRRVLQFVYRDSPVSTLCAGLLCGETPTDT